jgi:hypothetical protein
MFLTDVRILMEVLVLFRGLSHTLVKYFVVWVPCQSAMHFIWLILISLGGGWRSGNVIQED